MTVIPENEFYFRMLVELSADAMMCIDQQGNLLYTNPAYFNMFGYTFDEIRDDIFTVVHPEDILKVQAFMLDIMQGQAGKDQVLEFRTFTKDGRALIVESVGKKLPEGSVVGFVRDITQRKHEEEALRHLNSELEQRVRERTAEIEKALVEHRRLAAIIETTTDYVGIADLSGWSLYVNQAGRRMMGKPAEHYESDWNVVTCYPEHQWGKMQEMIETTLRGEAWSGEIVMKHYDGHEIFVSEVSFPLMDADGNIESIGTIIRDITGQKQIEAELQRAKEAAETANRAKSTFLANMSHEIRTSMNAIIGMTSLLLDTSLNAKQREFVEIVRSSSDALLTIINDILDFSKIEAEKLEIVHRPMDLRECIESALDLLAPRAAEKQIDLAYVIDSHTPTTIVGDVTRLRQILVNLLSNAVKFTDSGEVVVSVSSAPLPGDNHHEIRFVVRDTGIGIPPEKMDRLFKSFSQIDTSMTREYGGTGLGLVISKRLSEMMGGSMWVESDGIPGHGAAFHFTLVTEGIETPVRSHLYTLQPHLRDKTVLIVDDNPTNRRILSLQVQTWGMIPREAASPDDALVLLRTNEHFDVAILDMYMPEMDGQALGAAIRDLPVSQHLPLIMYTSLSQHNYTGDEFFAYLTKPVKPSELYNVLARLFSDEAVMVYSAQDAAPTDEVMLARRIPLRILLAEDVLVNQKFAVHALERMGYRVDVAANGVEVLEALERQPYDVILMDVQMPEMDGLEATRRIRKAQTDQPHIIAMTANAMQGDREICLEAGMDDYISKPVYIQELRAALERAGKNRRVQRDKIPQSASVQSLSFQTADIDPELAVAFLEESPLILEELGHAVARGDAQGIRKAAHKLKGGSGYIGAQTVFTLCAALEEKGRAGIIDDAPILFDQLKTALAEVQQVLTAAMME